jgi:hypothetical protein
VSRRSTTPSRPAASATSSSSMAGDDASADGRQAGSRSSISSCSPPESR